MGAIGPTVPRWRLGEELQHRREQAELTLADAAAELGCTEWKIRKVEAGQVGVNRGDLMLLSALYGIDKTDREHLDELRAQGTQRGWWAKDSKYLDKSQTFFFGIESAARRIRSWQPLAVHGLLQTEAYARALASGWPLSDDHAEAYVRIRMERQKLIWSREPTMWLLLDESVLNRQLTSPDVMAEQLAVLLDPPASCTIQILSLDSGPHPGSAGAFTIWEFDADLHSPIAHAETPTGSLYLEDQHGTTRAGEMMDRISAVAASPADSRRIIRAKMEELAHLQ